MQSGLIDSVAEAIASAKDPKEAARSAIETIALYYEGGLDVVAYGNRSASAEEVATAQAVISEMRRILSHIHDTRKASPTK